MKLALNDARISYSDCFHVDVTSERVVFSRPDWGGAGISAATPGARVRAMTNATRLVLSGTNTGQVTREDVYCAMGAVLVDGRVVQQFDVGAFSSTPQPFQVTLNNDAAEARLYEFILPHGAAVEITGLEVNDDALMLAPPPRPDVLCVAYGDSITQGFAASDVSGSWVFRLAQRNNWRLVNLGYGGRKATASDGITVAELKPSVVTFMVGYNDFAQQTALATFRAAVQGALAHILRLSPSTKVFVITPLWGLRDTLKPIHLEDYRQGVRNAVTALQSPQVHLIEGEPLTAPDRIAFPDGTHPGDLGNTQVFLSLLKAIQA